MEADPGVRHGDEKPHSHFITRLTGLEIDTERETLAERVDLKVVKVRVRRTDAHKLRNLAAAVAAALFGGSGCFGVAVGRELLH